jgi:hypothetical protein
MENVFTFITDISIAAMKTGRKNPHAMTGSIQMGSKQVHTLSTSTLHRSRQQQSASLSNRSIPKASLGTWCTGRWSGLTGNTHIVVVVIVAVIVITIITIIIITTTTMMKQSALQQGHNHFACDFFRLCDLVLPLSISISSHFYKVNQ